MIKKSGQQADKFIRQRLEGKALNFPRSLTTLRMGDAVNPRQGIGTFLYEFFIQAPKS
jgi:hypothetical protein